MNEAFELVKEGMKRGGVPAPLILATEQPWAETAIQEKLTKAYTSLEIKPLLVVLGPESPRKDLFCSKLMYKYMLTRNKNGLWLTPTKVPNSYSDGAIPNSGITVVSGTEMLTAFQLTALRQLMRDRLGHGAVFVVMLTSEKAFGLILGKDYFQHHAVMVEVPTPKVKPMKV